MIVWYDACAWWDGWDSVPYLDRFYFVAFAVADYYFFDVVIVVVYIVNLLILLNY